MEDEKAIRVSPDIFDVEDLGLNLNPATAQDQVFDSLTPFLQEVQKRRADLISRILENDDSISSSKAPGKQKSSADFKKG